MNVRLLRKIAKRIQETPEEFDMRDFHGFKHCGTTHCIGGWADFITNGEEVVHKGNSMERAIEALRITQAQANRLFFVSSVDGSVGWPEEFRGPDGDVWNPTIAQAAARIEHFIKTKGAE